MIDDEAVEGFFGRARNGISLIPRQRPFGDAQRFPEQIHLIQTAGIGIFWYTGIEENIDKSYDGVAQHIFQ